MTSASMLRRSTAAFLDWGNRFARACAPRRLARNLRNPIFQKEVFVAGRKRSTYVLRCALLLILLGIVGLSYLPMIFEHRVGETGLEFMQRVQELAPALTVIVVWFEYVTLMLIGPTLLGGSLCDERRSGTLGALLTTPLTAFQIALGKLVAGLSQLLILVLLAMPLLLVLRVFGGVQLEIVLGMAAVVLTSTILACTLSLFYSAKATRGFNAASSAIATMMVLHGGLSLAIVYAVSQRWIGLFSGQIAAMTLCGPASLGISSAQLFGSQMGSPIDVSRICLYNSVYSLLLSALVFFALVVRLRGVMLKDGGSAVVLLTRREKRKKSRARRSSAPAATTVPGSALPPDSPGTAPSPAAFSPSTQDSDRDLIEQNSRDVGDRPVLWRELTQPAFKSRFKMWLTIVLVTGLLIYMHSQIDTASDRHQANQVVMGLGVAICLFLGTGSAAASFAQERESRTLDVLMTTPLSAREIVAGKFWGAIRRQWFLPAVLLIHLLLTGVFASRIPFVAMLHAGVAIAVPIALVTAISVWMSVASKKSTAAGVKTALIGLGMWLLPFPVFGFLGGIASSIGGSSEWSEGGLALAATANPVFLAATSLTRIHSYDSDLELYALPYPVFTGSTGLLFFTFVFGLIMAAYAGLAFLALWRARVLLGRETNRLR